MVYYPEKGRRFNGLALVKDDGGLFGLGLELEDCDEAGFLGGRPNPEDPDPGPPPPALAGQMRITLSPGRFLTGLAAMSTTISRNTKAKIY